MEDIQELKWLKEHNIDVKSVEEMENLAVLDLARKGITEFPEFKHLKSLRELDLSYNRLINFSSNHPELKRLYLSYNNLTNFSGSYPELKRLIFYRNQLTTFSGNYPKLEKLFLCSSYLTKFSGDFPNLQELVLGDNQLTEFFGNYPNLTKLNLWHNKLTSFSGNFPRLEKLAISYNQLTEFSGSYPNLKALYLSYNNLAEFSGDFPELYELCIDNNPIKELPLWLSKVEEIQPFPFITCSDIELVNKILKDKLTAREVLGIEDIELRREAYERMDKSKMLALENYEVLDEGIDDKGNIHRIISFEIDGYEEPFKYYHCHCASSDREYFVGTNQDKVWAAKANSFGIAANVEWVNEW